MSEKAASLVAQAKQWATYYGPFTQGEESTALTVELRFRAAWDDNDADTLAEVFADNGSILLGDEQLNGRDAIHARLKEGFAGQYRNSRITEEPVEVKFLTEDVAYLLTEGGVLFAGEESLPVERTLRTTWIATRREGKWALMSHQSSPITG